MAKSLYVHIPFCNEICAYCDFTKLLYKKEWVDQYLSTLFFEIDQYKIDKVKTLYIGGGTPTSLDINQLESLLKYLNKYIDEESEFSFEVNVESISLDKIKLLKKYGVNRVSIGVESSIPSYLKLMNRKHNFEQVKQAIALFKENGISNINVDLIYALPNQSEEELMIDLSALLSLDVPHISTYSLILEANTKFSLMGIKEASQDIQARFYEIILSKLRSEGYERYEVSNFAKNKMYSKHNLTYWKNEEYYGVGLGASGYLNKIRYRNTKNLKKYLNKEFVEEKEEVNLSSEIEYFFITNLRLEKGFSISNFNKLFNVDFLSKYNKSIDKLLSLDLVEIKDDYFKTTDKGMLLLDSVLVELI